MESETKGLSLDSFPAVPGSYPHLGELSVSSVVVEAVWSGEGGAGGWKKSPRGGF